MKTTLIIASILATAFGAPALSPATRRQADDNLQSFTGALGGIEATPVTDSGNAARPFQVKGDAFVNIGAALARSCDQQFNACANAANGGDATLSVSACSTQQNQCTASAQGSAVPAQGNANANSGSAGNANASNGDSNRNAASCKKKQKTKDNAKIGNANEKQETM
ncbi:hypothetical protein IAQ61_007517 [Plenodomus lingam]|uniref:Predicted protein n=1 Tax=Leptosphaeria maculans (strain JN3 / isolate v23.1.3 / race Av1-4-5-6-7-8) TaxID=985895 RepID=E5A5H2_LEPMJ|nr:predicted protein [Plenodomus lingam JN3]KAH9866928.1 hypothetical protein IAQ61_007517 [Plenodomus lingam]CBX98870.1 predicted protein [Plenodomus lingam JN3]